MRLRKLAGLCEHDRFQKHPLPGATPTMILGSAGMAFADEDWCPGGVFLPDDTLIIEKVDGEWPEWAHEAVLDARLARDRKRTGILLDALSVREAEPEVDKNQMGMW